MALICRPLTETQPLGVSELRRADRLRGADQLRRALGYWFGLGFPAAEEWQQNEK
jgi:hypothetical protein